VMKDTMTTEQSKTIVHRLHAEVFIAGRTDTIDELVAADYVAHGPDGDQGREEHFQRALPAFRAAFPDLSYTFEEVMAEDDKVASRFTMQGTHRGKFLDIPPTGKTVTTTGMVLERVTDGKVAESWVERNDLSMIQQLGATLVPQQEDSRSQPSHADSSRHLLQTVLAGDVLLPCELYQLQSQLTGDVILHTDSRYNQIRTLWNDMIDKHPALIVRCMGTADIDAAVTFAREHDLPLSVCGGEHNIADTAVCDNGLVIDLSQMNGVSVDPQDETRKASMAGQISVHDAHLFWEKTSDTGEPLILVHGSWDDHHFFDAVVPTLAQSFQVFTYDRRGHNQRASSPSQDSITDDVADLAALIEELKLGSAHISGHSFGGSIVLRLAGQRPDLFRSLHVHSPPLLRLLADDPDEQQIYEGLNEHLAAVERLLAAGDMEGGTRQFVGSPDAWAEIPAEIKDVMIANAPTFLAELRDPEAFAFDLEQLRAFPHPALLTTSEHDMPFGSPVVEKVASVLPQAERVNVADANHDVQISQPEAFARTLRDFLTRVSVSA